MFIEPTFGYSPVRDDDGQPVLNDSGEPVMVKVEIGLRALCADAETYGNETGTPTTFTYSYRTNKIVHYPAQVAETTKYMQPKRDLNGHILWQRVREESFTPEEFLRVFSYAFAEPLLNAIADGYDRMAAMKAIRILKRDTENKKTAKRQEKDAELISLLMELSK